MDKDIGRVLTDQALAVPAEPVSRLGPSGVDPSRNGEGDSRNYRRSFYGILNKDGVFWTPLAFPSERAAWAHIEGFWNAEPDKLAYCRKHFSIILVHSQISPAIAIEAAKPARRAEDCGSTVGESAGLEEASPKSHPTRPSGEKAS